MEKGEQIEETVHREVKEETNLEVEIIKQFNLRVVPDGSFVVAFACKYLCGEIRLQEEEIKDYKWVKLEELKNFKLAFEELPKLADEALNLVKSKN